jgi:S1-C subfamily serine protease
MNQVLRDFSSGLADLTERAGLSAVGVEARRHMGSSGFLWKPGIIVTAAHAIRRDEDIPVILPDGKRTTAKLAGIDAGSDLAVLRAEGIAGPELTNGTTVRSGEIVVAVGRHAPGPLAAIGIVSTAGGPWMTWRGGQLESLLRLDLGAYPRSSGSALFNSAGEFIGMLTGGLTRTAPVAIPVATIERIAGELAAHGRVARGYLGIGLQTVPFPPSFATALGREQRSGVIVLSVEPDGPAAGAGIVPGDLVAEIGGRPVTDTDELQAALHGAIGRELPLVVFRGGLRLDLRARVGERRQ